ncbi:WD repeat-containing protein on Y chromosome like [Melia azedarach]|uniref:WD repeat-containing protein on Y chromosome like n=1 Tax=Melia azedarach TaxID=155640 RepID=A0ACC1YGJ4_MELAZ|nr:WD repeat-containing protein on Y chromosome like [Melia azedarach]
MAPQDKLVKAGLEGFALLEGVYGRKKKSAASSVSTITTTTITQAYDYHHHQYYNYNNQQQYVYRGPQVTIIREPVIDSNQAARFYGGISIVDHSIRKPIRRVY